MTGTGSARTEFALRSGALLVALVLALLLPAAVGCEEETEGNEVEVAFQSLVDAVQRRDATALYALTTNRSRAFLEDLARELAEAERLTRLYFPEWQQEAFTQHLALTRLGGAKDGRELFAKLVDFDKVREGDAVVEGLEHEPPVIQNDTATVKTAAGEVFLFVREDGTWRTTVYDAVLTLPVLETLKTNMTTLRENVARLRDLYGSARDPKSPEGAFNELRDALAKGDGRIALTLLDEEGRKAVSRLREALQKVKDLPEPDRKSRLAAAELGALDLATVLASDRTLAAALAASGRLRELIGVDATSAIHVVRITSRSEAVIVTTEADEFAFVLEKDGLWHLADVAAALDEALTAPLAAATAEGAPAPPLSPRR